MIKFIALLATLVLGAAPALAGLEIKTLELERGEVAYVDEGTGDDALILIHGLGADLSRWERSITPLATTHRVIAFDLFGFGHSARLAGDYRAQLFVDQIDAILNALGVERATLVGNSMGGWVAMLYAEQHPEKVDRLVLVAPAFVYGLPETVSADQLVSGAAPRTVQQMQAYLRRVYFAPPTDPETVQALLAEHTAKNEGSAIPSIARSIKAGEDTFTKDRVAAIATQTLVVHGTHDGIVPTAASKALAAILPNATLHIIDEVGHWPQFERPDAFNALFDR